MPSLLKTFILLKPDCTERDLTSLILAVFERVYTIDKVDVLRMTHQQAGMLYDKFRDEDFFTPLVDYMTSGTVVAVQLSSNTDQGIVDKVRKAALGLRELYELDFRRNTIHSSDSREAFEREAAIFFPPER